MTRKTVLALVAAVLLIAAAAGATAAIPPTVHSVGAPSKVYQKSNTLPVYVKGRICLNSAECSRVVW